MPEGRQNTISTEAPIKMYLFPRLVSATNGVPRRKSFIFKRPFGNNRKNEKCSPQPESNETVCKLALPLWISHFMICHMSWLYHDKWHAFSWNVTNYHHMSWNVTKDIIWHLMTRHLMTCHQMSNNVFQFNMVTFHDLLWCGQFDSERW